MHLLKKAKQVSNIVSEGPTYMWFPGANADTDIREQENKKIFDSLADILH